MFFGVGNVFGSKKMLSEIFLDHKKIWVGMFFGVGNVFGSKKIWSENFWQKKNWGRKKFWEVFGPKNLFCQKKFALKKFFGSKKM